MRRAWSVVVPICLLAALAVCPARAAVTGVWAVNDGEKIFRYDQEHPAKQANSVWDGKTIRLAGLYNEVLAFQLMVEADSFGATGVEVAVVPPRHAPSGRAIGAEAGAPYGPGGTIELFSEHYLQVTKVTQPLWFYGSPAAIDSTRMIGWIPDALIPPDARSGRGGFPLEIPRARQLVLRSQEKVEVIPTPVVQNQGFWVDLHLPRDRAYPAGLYQGRVIVRAQGATVAEIPLEVRLLPHYLPDENHSNIWMFGTSKAVAEYLGLPEAEADRLLKFESHRHRVDCVGGFKANGEPFDSELMESFRPWLDGGGYTPANGYQGPGQGQGDRLFPVGMYGSLTDRVFDSRESAWRESDRWVSWFEANAPKVTFFWYIIDEPGEVIFPWIKERAGWIHSNPGPGKKLPVFTTRFYSPELDQDIDIWAGHNGVVLDQQERLRAAGKQHWFYNGHRPRYGMETLETAAVDYRVNGWVKYIHGVSTWFLWESTTWQHNAQGPKGNLHQRVFSEPLTFINDGMNWSNGSGVIFYPGRMPHHPEEDRGLTRLLPSIRLKAMRRGQQDYELMWLAEQKVGREKVLELVKQAVPRSLEAELEEPTAWSQHGDDYDRVRLELLKLLGEQ